MKKIIVFLLSILTCASLMFGVSACSVGTGTGAGSGSGEQTEGVSNKLETPSVMLVGNRAEWKKVKNASSYRYKIGEDGEENVTMDLSIRLYDNQTIYVKAVGNRDIYEDSDWSEGLTYTINAVQLERPVCTLENGVVTWTAVENALYYEYKYEMWTDNNTEIMSSNGFSLPLTDGYLCVRAVGDGEFYSTSNWYQVKAPVQLKIEQGTVHLNGNTGEVNWEVKGNAIRYDYRIDNGAVVNGGRSGKIHLVDGQSIYFKAVGDGVNYLDSEWFKLTYSAGGGGDNGYV